MGVIKRHARRLWRQKVQRPARAKLHGLIQHYCDDCEKTVEPFHTCAPRSDFKRRRGQQARAEKRRRDGKRRDRRPPHDWRACRDDDCQVRVCVAFREGRESCPLPHQG